jgi:hypothetical protein
MFGDDFAHPEAKKSYKFMDIILGEIKKDLRFDKINAFYSTAEAFLQSLKNDSQAVEWP